MSISLSICIPTYNRAKYLPKLIDSILTQNSSNYELELVISDNASSDGTTELVENYQKQDRALPIVYHRFTTNMGADKNFLKCIELANKTFCWFLGSDDELNSNAISRIFDALAKYPTVAGISVDYDAYDYSLTKSKKHSVIGSYLGVKTDHLLLKTPQVILGTLGFYIGYLSGQIVNREQWLAIVKKYDYTKFFNAYVHVYVMALMVKANPAWLFLNIGCVKARSDNDSFMEKGRTKRALIDIYGFEEIAAEVYGKNSDTYSAWIRRVILQPIFGNVCAAKFDNKVSSREMLQLFSICLLKYYRFKEFWFKIFPVFVAPKFVLSYIRRTIASSNKD